MSSSDGVKPKGPASPQSASEPVTFHLPTTTPTDSMIYSGTPALTEPPHPDEKGLAKPKRLQKNSKKDTAQFAWSGAKPVSRGVSDAHYVTYASKKSDVTKTAIVKSASTYSTTVDQKLPTASTSTALEVLRAQIYRFYMPDSVPKTYLTHQGSEPKSASRQVASQDLSAFLAQNPDVENFDLNSFMRAAVLSLFLGEADLKTENFLYTTAGKIMRVDFMYGMETSYDLAFFLADPLRITYLVRGAEPIAKYMIEHMDEARAAIKAAVLDIVAAIAERQHAPELLSRLESDLAPGESEKTVRHLNAREAHLLSLPQVQQWATGALESKEATPNRMQKNFKKTEIERFDWANAKEVGRGANSAKRTDYVTKKGVTKQTITKRLLNRNEILAAHVYRFYMPDLVPKTYLVNRGDKNIGISRAVPGGDLTDLLKRDPHLQTFDLQSYVRSVFLSLFLGEMDLKTDNFLGTAAGKIMRIDFLYGLQAAPDLTTLFSDPRYLATVVAEAEILTPYILAHQAEVQEALKAAVLEVVAAIAERSRHPELLERMVDDVPPGDIEVTALHLAAREAHLLSLPQVQKWMKWR